VHDDVMIMNVSNSITFIMRKDPHLQLGSISHNKPSKCFCISL